MQISTETQFDLELVARHLPCDFSTLVVCNWKCIAELHTMRELTAIWQFCREKKHADKIEFVYIQYYVCVFVLNWILINFDVVEFFRWWIVCIFSVDFFPFIFRCAQKSLTLSMHDWMAHVPRMKYFKMFNGRYAKRERKKTSKQLIRGIDMIAHMADMILIHKNAIIKKQHSYIHFGRAEFTTSWQYIKTGNMN